MGGWVCGDGEMGEMDNKKERGWNMTKRRMEMSIMLHDKRVHLVSNESVKCMCATAGDQTFNPIIMFQL